MIDEDHYQLPHNEPKHEPTEEERREAEETLRYLETLPFRPHGEEW